MYMVCSPGSSLMRCMGRGPAAGWWRGRERAARRPRRQHVSRASGYFPSTIHCADGPPSLSAMGRKSRSTSGLSLAGRGIWSGPLSPICGRSADDALCSAKQGNAMQCLRLASLVLTLVMGTAVAGPPARTYAEGQVWEYRTRPEDKGSLLKIQKIDVLPEFTKTGPVYHISIIGVHFIGLPLDGTLQHAPFSKAALDASVTKLSSSKAVFPDIGEGIAEWKRAQGGVFTVSVAEAVSFAEETLRRQKPAQPNGS